MSQKWRLPTRYISEEVIAYETIYQRYGNDHRRTAFRSAVHPYDRIPVVFDSGRVRLDCDINEGGNEMNVNIKRLSPDAQIPAYAHTTDAGFDLVASEDVIIEPGETACVPTGLAFEIPEGYEMQIRPRSGITLKTPLRVQLGTVDCGYTGEVGVIVDNIAQKIGEETTFYKVVDGYWEETEKAEFFDFELDDYRYGSVFVPENTCKIRKGDRIAQAVIKPVEQAVFTEVDTLGDSDRGVGGFGSSGVIAKEEETHLKSSGLTFDLPKEDA